MNNKVLLTGSNGYLGSHIKRALLKSGFEVITLGRSDADILWSLESSLVKEISGATTLIHCAWDMKISCESENYRINVEGTKNLVNSCISLGVSKIIFISTTSAYEGTQSVYGQTKFEIEKWLEQFQAIIVRPGLLWGSESGSMMQALFKIVTRLPIIPVFGARQLFYMTEVEALSVAIVQLIQDCSLYRKDFPVIASSKPIAFIDLLKVLARRSNKKRIFIAVPWRPIYWLFLLIEKMGFKPPFKSDSLISLMTLCPNQKVNSKLLISDFKSS